MNFRAFCSSFNFSSVSRCVLRPRTLVVAGFISLVSISSPILMKMAYCTSAKIADDLTLYSYHHSFYAQKVLLVLYEKKLPFKLVSIDLTRHENYRPSFLKINPRGEVPVLKTGNEIMPDSTRIINYLEEKFSDEVHPSMTPADSALREKAKSLREKIDAIPANKITFAACNHDEMTSNQKYPFSMNMARQGLKDTFRTSIPVIRQAAESTEDPRTKEILLQKVASQEIEKETISDIEVFNELLGEIEILLNYIETHLGNLENGAKWLVSDQFTLADVSLAILLDRLHRVGLSDTLWNQNNKRPLIKKYYERVVERPSFKYAVPNFVDDVKQFIRRILPL